MIVTQTKKPGKLSMQNIPIRKVTFSQKDLKQQKKKKMGGKQRNKKLQQQNQFLKQQIQFLEQKVLL